MSGPFVTAVTQAIESGWDNWEINYYYMRGTDHEWRLQHANVYLETRCSALGPEWRTHLRCVMQMRGEIPRCEVGYP